MARELRELLRDTGQVGPYVVVGHSMGAGVVRWFELEHSDEVAGMVLVDPATADSITQAFATVPADALAEYDRNVRRMEGIDRETYLAGFTSLRNSGHRLGDRPLFVLTARKPESSFELRQQLRSEVNSLSSNVVRVTAENSGHDIPTDEPALVTRAILAVVRAVRTHQPVSKAWSAEGG
jgi:pimeloyl-ACP methyl ester carboxylesterase